MRVLGIFFFVKFFLEIEVILVVNLSIFCIFRVCIFREERKRKGFNFLFFWERMGINS